MRFVGVIQALFEELRRASHQNSSQQIVDVREFLGRERRILVMPQCRECIAEHVVDVFDGDVTGHRRLCAIC